MYRTLILALDGVMDSSLALTRYAIVTADRLSALRSNGTRFAQTVFCPGRSRIRTGLGTTIAVQPEIGRTRYDALVVPGLGLTKAEEIDRFFARRSSRAVVEWLKRHRQRFPLVGASCSAVFLLAEAGLLRQRTATTTWWLAPTFRDRHPDVDLDETRMLVETDGILCAGAALAQIDLMLHLIARAAGPDLSRDVSRALAIDRRPSQSRYMMLSAVAGLGKEVVAIERWIRANLSRAFSIPEMASTLGMSTRTLDRRVRVATGRGPSHLVQRIRLEQATHLIETSALSLDEVADRVGYGDATTLRRLLRRHLDMNPSEMRRQSRLESPRRRTATS